MLPKQHRIQKEKDFALIFAKGKPYRNGQLLLKAYDTAFPYPRVGVVVSKKVSRLAVTRNRIKRIIREALRPRLSGMAKGKDLVFIVLPGFVAQNRAEAEALTLPLLKKALLLS